MSGSMTKRMISAYFQEAAPTPFLSRFFAARPENFHNSEEVEIDIMRGNEEVSVVIQDLSTGYRMNSSDVYTNKRFKPPIHKEAIPLNAFDLIKREFGQNPFQNPDFQANATVRSFRAFRKIEAKIRRAVELQASQILQTGELTLIDNAGNSVYALDFQPKSSHFPNAGTAWSAGGYAPLTDLGALADVIRGDGLMDPDTLIFGQESLNLFLANADVQKRLDLRRAELGEVRPEMRDSGANYIGRVFIGNYWFDIWSYRGRFTHPSTGVSTPFVADDKVIMMSSGARMDATFGAIPRIAPPESRVLPFLPGRMSSGDARMDLFTNAWLSPDGEQLFVGAGGRPLLIPTAIDTYGCLDTGI